MNVDALIDMDEDAFADAVMQAAKRRTDFPEWWRLVLQPEVIDDTEIVIQNAVAHAKRQATEPDRYPSAAGFVSKMRGVLAEVTLAKLTAGDT